MFQFRLPLFNSSNIFDSLTKVLALVSVLLFIYILARFFAINKEMATLNPNSMTTTASIDSKNKILPSFPPFTQYAQAVEGQNFFQTPKIVVAEATPEVPKEPTPQDLTKNIKVLGIMLSQKPQAVVLNQTTNQTLILSLGDTINNLRLSEIQKDQIIFDHDGQLLKVHYTK